MEYVYPAIFHKNDDGSYTITYPDLPGCISEGKNLGNALYMAQSALKQWIGFLLDKEMKLPSASTTKSIKVTKGELVNLICAEIKDSKAVKRTVSIPKWMDDKVTQTGLSLSKVLQDALSEKLETDNPVKKRIGFLKNQVKIPIDFNKIGQNEIIEAFQA